MKIGFITFHNVTNYGAMLQAFASQENLKKLGYEAEIINYIPPKVVSFYKPFSLYKYKKLWGKSKILVFREFAYDTVFFPFINKRNKVFSSFGEKFYNLSEKRYKTPQALKKTMIDYDLCFAGSDQIWNPEITDGFDAAYFLDFGREDMVRASYAASIGSDNCSEEEKMQLKDLLRKFDSISIREETAAEIIAPYSTVEPCVVIDPTLLLTASEWKQLLSIEDSAEQEYIFVFNIVDNCELDKYVELLSKKTGLPVKTVNRKRKYKNEVESVSLADPVRFVELIAQAKHVITNSFHGMAFSINFSKDFVAFKNATRNSRITDLLEKLGMPERAIAQCEEKIMDLPDIDYESVHKKLQEEIDKANKYITSVIEKAEK